MTNNLPPLPKGDITYHITDSTMRRMECDAHSDSQMQSYARAAIEAALAARGAVPAGPVPDFTAFEAAVREYIEEYEMRGETEDGRDACYTPNENDKALLLDAIMGFDFSPWRSPAPPMKAADEFELRRLLAEERETVRQLIRSLREATDGPTFMGEPALAAPQQVAQPSAPVCNCNVDMRIAAIAADRDYWQEMCKEAERLAQAKPEQAAQPRDQIGADRLAAAVARLVSSRSIDARSEAADALLDYLDVGGVGGPSDVPAWLAQYEKRQAEKDPK